MAKCSTIFLNFVLLIIGTAVLSASIDGTSFNSDDETISKRWTSNCKRACGNPSERSACSSACRRMLNLIDAGNEQEDEQERASFNSDDDTISKRWTSNCKRVCGNPSERSACSSACRRMLNLIDAGNEQERALFNSDDDTISKRWTSNCKRACGNPSERSACSSACRRMLNSI